MFFFPFPILPIPIVAPAMQAKGGEMVKPSNTISCVKAQNNHGVVMEPTQRCDTEYSHQNQAWLVLHILPSSSEE